jgi:hypothetical protein
MRCLICEFFLSFFFLFLILLSMWCYGWLLTCGVGTTVMLCMGRSRSERLWVGGGKGAVWALMLG